MYSMTGFGKGDFREGGLEIGVELKSVNNRFLDISVRCPHILNPYEETVRALIRESLSRGHIDVFVSVLDKREKERSVYVDLAAARAYARAAESLKEAFPEVPDDITLSFLLKSPDVVRTEEAAEADEALAEGLKQALRAALGALREMRGKEGERLKADLLARMDTISALRDGIAERAPLVAEEYRKRLAERVAEFLGGTVDENRILTEAAVFADKCNIDEELTRLSSHITEFRRICKESIVGRKLDFLVQEFNRECNTICSKSNDARITALALDMKNEIEKVREQIQNLE